LVMSTAVAMNAEKRRIKGLGITIKYHKLFQMGDLSKH
jgi:hypothetical protein